MSTQSVTPYNHPTEEHAEEELAHISGSLGYLWFTFLLQLWAGEDEMFQEMCLLVTASRAGLGSTNCVLARKSRIVHTANRATRFLTRSTLPYTLPTTYPPATTSVPRGPAKPPSQTSRDLPSAMPSARRAVHEMLRDSSGLCGAPRN